jgi:lysine 2,3-aminomutase
MARKSDLVSHNSPLASEWPSVRRADYNDWRWQMRHRLKSPEDFTRAFDLSETERKALSRRSLGEGGLPIALTPYYASLMSRTDPEHPLRRAHIPREDEFQIGPGEYADPLGEEQHQVAPGIVHRYPDRVLFLVTNQCPVYCRYCMRSRLVGKMDREHLIPISQWEASIAYIKSNTTIREVLLSGGEPLMLGDERLAWLMRELDAIEHLDIIRFSTKTPAVLPQRITPDLIRALKVQKPIWMALHLLHPLEFTPEFITAMNRLARAGFVLTTQTPLLKGVNDNADTMRELMQLCIRHRIRPYYLFQCDPIHGSAYLRTPISKGLEIIEALQGSLSGHAVPHFVVDALGAGKMPLAPQRYTGSENGHHHFVNFRGERVSYYDGEDVALYAEKTDLSASA